MPQLPGDQSRRDRLLRSLRGRPEAGGAEELARLAELELRDGNREEAAGLLYQAIIADPSIPGYPKLYKSEFTEKELLNWSLGKPPVAIWNDIPNILIYPFTDGQWLGLILNSMFIAFCFMAGRFGIFGIVALLTGWGWLITQTGKHIKWAALGKPGHPQVMDLEFSYLWYFFVSALFTFFIPLFLALYFIFFKEFILLGFLFGSLALFLVIFIFPMTFLACTLFNSAGMAFSYLFILRSILNIFVEYLFGNVLLLVLGGAIFVAKLFVLISLTPVLGNFFASAVVLPPGTFLELYFATIYAHVLGRLYYNNQKKLSWF